jgi:hypothetical protein
VQRGRPGADGAAGLKALMAQHYVTSGQVRAWANDTGRDLSPVGLPPRALVEQYINESATTRRESA